MVTVRLPHIIFFQSIFVSGGGKKRSVTCGICSGFYSIHTKTCHDLLDFDQHLLRPLTVTVKSVEKQKALCFIHTHSAFVARCLSCVMNLDVVRFALKPAEQPMCVACPRPSYCCSSWKVFIFPIKCLSPGGSFCSSASNERLDLYHIIRVTCSPRYNPFICFVTCHLSQIAGIARCAACSGSRGVASYSRAAGFIYALSMHMRRITIVH